MSRNELADIDISKMFAKAGLSVLGETGSRVVFRSNVTPDITIDLSGLMKVKAQEISTEVEPTTTDTDTGIVTTEIPDAEEVPVSSTDTKLLKVIRPEISLNALGNQVSYAPYGKPQRAVAVAFVFALIASAIIGAKIAWVMCKKV